MSNTEEIKKFVMAELKKRQITEEINDDTSLVLSGKLDSLFVVDLILFLETHFNNINIKIEDIKPDQIDNLKKIYRLVKK